MTPDVQLLSTGEVAALADVAPTTVMRWARSGRLAHVRTPGGRLKFRRTDVERMLTPTGGDEQPGRVSA